MINCLCVCIDVCDVKHGLSGVGIISNTIMILMHFKNLFRYIRCRFVEPTCICIAGYTTLPSTVILIKSH